MNQIAKSLKPAKQDINHIFLGKRYYLISKCYNMQGCFSSGKGGTDCVGNDKVHLSQHCNPVFVLLLIFRNI